MKALRVEDPDSLIPQEKHAEFGAVKRRHPEVAVLRLRNARVSGHGLVLTEDGHLLPESNLRPPHVEARSDEGAVLAAAPTSPIARLCDTPVVALNGVWPVHYGHWTYDNFSRLGLAQEAIGFRPYSILTGYRNRGGEWCRPETIQGRMLSMACIGAGQIHRLADANWIEVADLVVVSPLNNFRPPVGTIYAQREMFSFLKTLKRQVSVPGKGLRIYCSRRDTENRKMENEADLVRVLTSRFGFVEVMLGEYGVEEQIAIFGDAEIVVGPVGNAFMNMAYMKSTAKVVVFLPPETWHFLPYYQTFATAGGFDIRAVVSGTSSAGSSGNLNALRWSVDVRFITEYVADLI